MFPECQFKKLKELALSIFLMRLLDNNPIGNIGVKLIIKAELPELSTLWMSKYSILF